MPVVERQRVGESRRAAEQPLPARPDQADDYDGLRAARGCLYSLVINLAVWGVVIAIVVLR